MTDRQKSTDANSGTGVKSRPTKKPLRLTKIDRYWYNLGYIAGRQDEQKESRTA